MSTTKTPDQLLKEEAARIRAIVKSLGKQAEEQADILVAHANNAEAAAKSPEAWLAVVKDHLKTHDELDAKHTAMVSELAGIQALRHLASETTITDPTERLRFRLDLRLEEEVA